MTSIRFPHVHQRKRCNPGAAFLCLGRSRQGGRRKPTLAFAVLGGRNGVHASRTFRILPPIQPWNATVMAIAPAAAGSRLSLLHSHCAQRAADCAQRDRGMWAGLPCGPWPGGARSGLDLAQCVACAALTGGAPLATVGRLVPQGDACPGASRLHALFDTPSVRPLTSEAVRPLPPTGADVPARAVARRSRASQGAAPPARAPVPKGFRRAGRGRRSRRGRAAAAGAR